MEIGQWVGPYELTAEIGKGSFATVYRAAAPTSSPVALKAVVRAKLTPKLLDSLESEIRLLRALSHPHVVALRDCIKTDAHICLVMDYCSAGDLARFIRLRGDVEGLHPNTHRTFPHPQGGGLNLSLARAFSAQLASALEYLRRHDVLHRDIKPQNLLLQLDPDSSQEIPLLRVADFGFARFLPQSSLAETLCGSPLYMAPEILRYEKYDAKADLWSAGAVFYEMVTGRPPFRAANHIDLLRKIERSRGIIRFPDEVDREKEKDKDSSKPAPQVVPADIKELIRNLLKLNPVERISFPEFVHVTHNLIAANIALPTGEDKSAAFHVSRPDQAGAFARPTNTKLEPTRPPPSPPGISRRTSGDSPAPQTVSQPAGISRRASGGSPAPQTVSQPAGISRRASGGSPAPQTVSQPAEQPPIYFAPKYYVGGATTQSPDSRPPTSRTSTTNSANDPPATDPLAPKSSSTNSSAAARKDPQNDGISNVKEDNFSDSSVLGREYVVVEKSAVEVNALADEIGSSPRSIPARRTSTRHVLNRPLGLLSSPDAAEQPSNLSHTPRSLPQESYPPSGTSNSPEKEKGHTGSHIQSEKSNVKPSYDLSTTPPFARSPSNTPVDPGGTSGVPSPTPARTKSDITTTRGFIEQGSSESTARTAAIFRHSPPRSSPLANEAFSKAPSSTALTSHTPASAYGRSQSTVPSNALARALSAATNTSVTSPLKLFSASATGRAPQIPALKTSSKSSKTESPPSNWYWLTHFLRLKEVRQNRRGTSPIIQSSFDQLDSEQGLSSNDSVEAKVLDEIEDYAQKASVLFDLADEKLLHFLPIPPSAADNKTSFTTSKVMVEGSEANKASPFLLTSGTGVSGPRDDLNLLRNDQATQKASSFEAAEALQLYMKALVFLRRGIEEARDFIQKGRKGEDHRRQPGISQGPAASSDMNDFVQWLRARFNECLDKAHFAKSCCVEQKVKAVQRPVQRLVYEGALEMSRAAAVSELHGMQMETTQTAYETALWMLYALIDPIMNDSEERDVQGQEKVLSKLNADDKDHQLGVRPSEDEEAGYDGLNSEDIATIQKFIQSIQGRLSSVNRDDSKAAFKRPESSQSVEAS